MFFIWYPFYKIAKKQLFDDADFRKNETIRKESKKEMRQRKGDIDRKVNENRR